MPDVTASYRVSGNARSGSLLCVAEGAVVGRPATVHAIRVQCRVHDMDLPKIDPVLTFDRCHSGANGCRRIHQSYEVPSCYQMFLRLKLLGVGRQKSVANGPVRFLLLFVVIAISNQLCGDS